MRVWHHVLRPESLTYTVAKALSLGGHEVVVSAARPGFAGKPPGEIERRIHEIPGVTVVARAIADLPDVIERLIVQVHPRPADTLEGIRALADRARKITLISAGDRNRSPAEVRRVQWLELRRLGLNLRKVDRVLYKDGYRSWDLLGWLAPRDIVGFDAHSQYLHGPDLYRAIHARDWDPASRRSIRANFIGSRDPTIRTAILDSMRDAFTHHATSPPPALRNQTMLWREYSDEVPDALLPEEFVRILTDCDFTVCPRGYSVVTHRPVEALLRGSIPILAEDELDLYGFALENERNCIAVPTGAWAAAIERIVGMNERQIIQMRKNIHTMFARDLDYAALAGRIRARLGVVDASAQSR